LTVDFIREVFFRPSFWKRPRHNTRAVLFVFFWPTASSRSSKDPDIVTHLRNFPLLTPFFFVAAISTSYRWFFSLPPYFHALHHEPLKLLNQLTVAAFLVFILVGFDLFDELVLLVTHGPGSRFLCRRSTTFLPFFPPPARERCGLSDSLHQTHFSPQHFILARFIFILRADSNLDFRLEALARVLGLAFVRYYSRGPSRFPVRVENFFFPS